MQTKDKKATEDEEKDGGEKYRDPYVPHSDDEDEEKDPTPNGSGDLDDAGSYEERSELPDTPTGHYQKGGLGMGSKYFCSDDIRY